MLRQRQMKRFEKKKQMKYKRCFKEKQVQYVVPLNFFIDLKIKFSVTKHESWVLQHTIYPAHSAGAVEYTDCISAER